MEEEILSKLFGSASRLKAIRFFLLNPSAVVNHKEFASKCGISSESARREINFLKRIGLIEQTEVFVAAAVKEKKAKKALPKKRARGWRLNKLFPLTLPLRKLVIESVPVNKKKIVKSIQSAGKIQLIVLSGIFTDAPESRLDILIVGDGIKKRKIERAIARIEAEIGRDIVYAVLTTRDFFYRLDMYDKFIFGVLDYPHEKLLNKLTSDKI